MKTENNNLILDLSFKFALKVIDFCEALEMQKKFSLARQLFRAGTSIGANICEAQRAESRSDFIHKLKISDKESEETKYWLQLCKFSNKYPDCDELIADLLAIKRILGKIIYTSRMNHS